MVHANNVVLGCSLFMFKQQETRVYSLHYQSNAVSKTDTQFGNLGNNGITFDSKEKELQVNNSILRNNETYLNFSKTKIY